MQEALYQYLITHQQLQLPGIGQLVLQYHSADIDYNAQKINAPFVKVLMNYTENEEAVNNQHLWVSGLTGAAPEHTAADIGKWVNKIKSVTGNGQQFLWPGIGLFKKGHGRVVFEPENENRSLGAAYPAEKIINIAPVYNTELNELSVSKPSEKKVIKTTAVGNNSAKYWWVPGIILILLALGTLAWLIYTRYTLQNDYFSNEQKIHISSPATQYFEP